MGKKNAVLAVFGFIALSILSLFIKTLPLVRFLIKIFCFNRDDEKEMFLGFKSDSVHTRRSHGNFFVVSSRMTYDGLN